MGKVDVGGGKPLAPSPKQPVAAPAPKHVVASPSFPKPSRASVYRGSATHQASHSTGYGPRPTGSGVHARVQAQPVTSKGHSANVARLAAKLTQQTTVSTQANRLQYLNKLLSKPSVWETQNQRQWAYSPFALLTNPGISKALRDAGLLPSAKASLPYGVGPQGGYQLNDPSGYDRLPPNQPRYPTLPQAPLNNGSNRYLPMLRSRKPPTRKDQYQQGLPRNPTDPAYADPLGRV